MGEKSIVSTIIQSFPRGTREIWRQAASAEINGGDPLEQLSWNNSDGLKFSPYYDREDVAGSNSSKRFSLPEGKVSVATPRQWLNAPYVIADEVFAANKISLEHLKAGADAIFFSIIPSKPADLKNLLSEIEWNYCSLFFPVQENQSETLHKYITDAKFGGDTLTGALFWDMPPKKGTAAFLVNETSVKSLGITVRPATPVNEIATALAQTVRLIETRGENLQTVFGNLAYSITASTDFFETVCKLKALRGLIFQLANAYEVSSTDIHIHVVSEPWIKEAYQPHGNLIGSTAAAMAAIIGGCDALTVKAETQSNMTMTRIARNVSSVLREESHFDKVADPAEGAYLFDVMTDRIAKEAWARFQNEMK